MEKGGKQIFDQKIAAIAMAVTSGTHAVNRYDLGTTSSSAYKWEPQPLGPQYVA
jgi:hypothetical protein